MDAAFRWPRSTPWRRVWPAAILAVALHLSLLEGWPVTGAGLHRTERLVSSIQIRLLEAQPAAVVPSVAPPPPAPPSDSGLPSAQAQARTNRDLHGAGPKPLARETVTAKGPFTPEALSPAPALRPAPEYLIAGSLDPGPKLLEDIDPVYPVEAGLREGTVVLRLLIGKNGAVDEVSVVRSTPSELFDRAALAAFSQARFSPGMMLGVPVKSQMTIELHFTPVDRGGNVSAPTY